MHVSCSDIYNISEDYLHIYPYDNTVKLGNSEIIGNSVFSLLYPYNKLIMISITNLQ